MRIDIHAAVITALVMTILGAMACVWLGMRAIRAARRISFFRIRRQRLSGGWRLFALAVLLASFSYVLGRFGEPVAYRYFPPSPTLSVTPTISLTPSITLTPTISNTPTISLTPAISDTPTETSTPYLPLQILSQFKATVSPNPVAVFSPLVFATRIDNYQPVNPATVFLNPVGHMFATYSYDGMLDGSQWTAMWYRDGELVYAETSLWQGGSGGYGYADWNPSPDKWLPGKYEVQIFVGTEWKVVGRFTVRGEPVTLTPTRTPTITPTSSNTPTTTYTLYPTWTPRPTDTRWPTPTQTK